MSAFFAAVAGGLVGAFVGYLLRASEFRRAQRLKVYGEIVGAVVDVIHSGAEVQSHGLGLGQLYEVKDPELRQTYKAAWDRHDDFVSTFEASLARLRMIASAPVRGKAEEIETWIAANVQGVPPFNGEKFDERAKEGKIGPRFVDTKALPLVKSFADVAGRDVNTWLTRRGWTGRHVRPAQANALS